MHIFDYIVVGAGSAGCAIARRLSEDPRQRVLLVEAGGSDDSLLIRMLRGRVIGGSSSVNGIVYVRSQPADYHALHEAGCTGWNWATMHECFRRIEGHLRGVDGLRVADLSVFLA